MEAHEVRIVLQETPACEEVFEQFLKFFYAGKIQIRYQNIIPIMMLADKYLVEVKIFTVTLYYLLIQICYCGSIYYLRTVQPFVINLCLISAFWTLSKIYCTNVAYLSTVIDYQKSFCNCIWVSKWVRKSSEDLKCWNMWAILSMLKFLTHIRLFLVFVKYNINFVSHSWSQYNNIIYIIVDYLRQKNS